MLERNVTNVHKVFTATPTANLAVAIPKAPQVLNNAMKNLGSAPVNQYTVDKNVIGVYRGSTGFPIVSRVNAIQVEQNLNLDKEMLTVEP